MLALLAYSTALLLIITASVNAGNNAKETIDNFQYKMHAENCAAQADIIHLHEGNLTNFGKGQKIDCRKSTATHEIQSYGQTAVTLGKYNCFPSNNRVITQDTPC